MTYSLDLQTGVITPDTSTMRDEVAAEWRTAFGANFVTAPDTPQGVMVTAEALAREAVANNNAQLANQINPDLAGGPFLDAICALMGIERRGATASVIPTVLLTGQPGVLVPSGAQARSVDGSIWTLRSNVLLASNGQATGAFVCTTTGPTGCQIGELSEVMDMVLGWEAVYNTSAALPGTLEESDAELRSRRRVTLARQGISTREAQLSGLMDIDGVTSAVFRENVTNATTNVDGISMVAHSVWACVDGGSDAEIAMSLLKNKTDGANWNGATVVPVTDPASGQVYNVKFDRPVYQYPSIRVYVRQGNSAINPITEIPRTVVLWAQGKMPGDPGLTIGTMVSAFEVAGAINFYNPGFFINRIEIWGNGVIYPSGYPITLLQRAIIEASAVQVYVEAV